jgi:5-methylcytosine-specific restriction protein B
VDEVYHAFVEHPDYSKDDFITKLKRQMQHASPPAQQLLAEMLWALLLFPSNMKAKTKQRQIREMWSLSGQQLPDDLPLMRDDVLTGIGSGGPGFNNIDLTR